jgi:hypothetical protein
MPSAHRRLESAGLKDEVFEVGEFRGSYTITWGPWIRFRSGSGQLPVFTIEPLPRMELWGRPFLRR